MPGAGDAAVDHSPFAEGPSLMTTHIFECVNLILLKEDGDFFIFELYDLPPTFLELMLLTACLLGHRQGD